ncbi:hypothetical protein, partial [Pararcticibacter amylolyticus]|uniref:hypothetical protein n=1 Tax=Pararcticibacter amylolyticus TaxID=2173175 RepID=UPI001EE42EB9
SAENRFHKLTKRFNQAGRPTSRTPETNQHLLNASTHHAQTIKNQQFMQPLFMATFIHVQNTIFNH